MQENNQELGKRKRHYPWWGYVKYIVRKYPEWDKIPLHEEMSRVESKGWSAVRGAINHTERMDDGPLRLKVIQAMHWDRTLTLEGAALSIPCSRATAARWQREFFEEVARNLGLLD